MHNFLEIMLKADNIPIAGMLVAVLICLWASLKQGLRNDRLTKEGKHDQLYDEMVK
ncbi:MAG: hypothetical protein HYY85_10865 [Deltaproteobacteria bacterium]|nr:hypothetical protein [Deltaproteobacteria bacterium]